MIYDYNRLTPDINATVEYNAILCHKPIEKDGFQDYCNRLYLSDNGIENTIDITNKEFPTKLTGEFSAWLWLANNIRENDRATLHHYRRKLPLSISPIVLPQPMQFRCTILEHIAYYHSPIIAEAMVKTLNQTEMQILNGNALLCWNIFKAPQPIIKQWCEYCGNKLKMLSDVLNCPIEVEAVNKFVKDKKNGMLEAREGKNVEFSYQTRFYACALERYSHCFWNLIQCPKEYKQVNLLEDGQKI